ncbi:MAG: rhomboid family intramembrane serine protease [Parafilimonas sp.]
MTEFRPGSFQILPTIIKNLIIINVLVYLAQITLAHSGFSLEDKFALHTWQSPLFKPWQFITHLFMHGGWDHLFFNMFALWMFGSILENIWGPKRFLTFYIICGLGAALGHMIALYYGTNVLLNDYLSLQQHLTVNGFSQFSAKHDMSILNSRSHELINEWQQNPSNPGLSETVLQISNVFVNAKLDEPTIGASGAIFGCLAAFGYLFPNTYIYIYFLFPLKAKWFVLIYAGFELFTAIKNSAGDNVAHFAHLAGAVVGLALVYFWNKTNRRTLY